eukprot:scaffold156112_cov41-Prasinocladus_malaysianus.AAC.1
MAADNFCAATNNWKVDYVTLRSKDKLATRHIFCGIVGAFRSRTEFNTKLAQEFDAEGATYLAKNFIKSNKSPDSKYTQRSVCQPKCASILSLCTKGVDYASAAEGLSYQTAPRSQIFRRDAFDVTDLQSL